MCWLIRLEHSRSMSTMCCVALAALILTYNTSSTFGQEPAEVRTVSVVEVGIAAPDLLSVEILEPTYAPGRLVQLPGPTGRKTVTGSSMLVSGYGRLPQPRLASYTRHSTEVELGSKRRRRSWQLWSDLCVAP